MTQALAVEQERSVITTSPRSKVKQSAFLSREDEARLLAMWLEEKDYEARERVITAHQPFVKSIAVQFRKFTARPAISMSDLVAEGNMGLMRAIDGFRAEFNVRFSTYAKWWVLSRMRDYVNTNLDSVRVIRSRTEVQALTAFNRRPDMDEAETAALAERLGLERRDLEVIKGLASHPASFSANRPISIESEDGDTFIDLIEDERTGVEAMMGGVLQDRQAVIAEQLIEEAMLKPREREILRRRWLADEPEQLKDIAVDFGLTPERIRQIDQAIMDKLHRAAKRLRIRSEDVIGDVQGS